MKAGLTNLLNSHSKCRRVNNEWQIIFYNYDAFKLLGSSVGSEESNRSRGGAKLAPGPSVKARPWPKAET